MGRRRGLTEIGRASVQRGFTLIEVLAALAVGALLTAGIAGLIVSLIEDARGQQAALRQAQVTAAATQFIGANYDSLRTGASATAAVAVSVAELKSAGLLPEGFGTLNAYGQVSCVLVVQPSAGKLDALVVTEGGPTAIPQKDLAYVASNSGAGAGFIPYGGAPRAVGSFDTWSITPEMFAHYTTANCSGAAADEGHLANAIFFDGPGHVADFVYRSAVAGHPELNGMTTPLHMAAVATEDDASDPLCTEADASAQGRIAVDAAGAVLSCQSGVWRRQGSAFWRDPVETFAALPTTPANNVGDVRMVTTLSRAFTWNGAAWVALAVDESGNMSVPGKLKAAHLQVNAAEVPGTICSPNGLIARDASGLLLSCQNGLWQPQATAQLGYTEVGDVVIMKSSYMAYPADTVFYTGPFTYDALNDWMASEVVRNIVPTKDGQIIVNASSLMARQLVTDPSVIGQFRLTVSLIDLDTGALTGVSRTQSPVIRNDGVGITTTLSKVVPKNTNGYALHIDTRWGTYKGSAADAFYDQANYTNTAGGVVEVTPLETSWTLDLTY